MLTGVIGVQFGKRIFMEAEWIDHDHIFVGGHGYKVYRENYGGCLAIYDFSDIECLLQSDVYPERFEDRPEKNLTKNEYIQEVERLKKQYKQYNDLISNY